MGSTEWWARSREVGRDEDTIECGGWTAGCWGVVDGTRKGVGGG